MIQSVREVTPEPRRVYVSAEPKAGVIAVSQPLTLSSLLSGQSRFNSLQRVSFNQIDMTSVEAVIPWPKPRFLYAVTRGIFVMNFDETFTFETVCNPDCVSSYVLRYVTARSLARASTNIFLEQFLKRKKSCFCALAELS